MNEWDSIHPAASPSHTQKEGRKEVLHLYSDPNPPHDHPCTAPCDDALMTMMPEPSSEEVLLRENRADPISAATGKIAHR